MPTPNSEIVTTLIASMESLGIAVGGLIGLGLTVVGIGFGLVATGPGFWTRFLRVAGTAVRLCRVVFAFTVDDGAGAVVAVYVGAGGVYVDAGGVYVGAGGGLGFTGAGSGFGVAALAAGAGTLAISPSTRAASASWSRRAAVPPLAARARPVSGTRLMMTTRRPGAIRWMRGRDTEHSCLLRYGRD